jgi:hypothetical protein
MSSLEIGAVAYCAVIFHSECVPALGSMTSKVKRLAACARCRAQKIKCKWNGNSACKACEANGVQAACGIVMSKPPSQQSTHSNSLPPPVSSISMTSEVVLMHKYQSAVRAVEDTDVLQKTAQQPATATRQKHDHSEVDMNVSLSAECQHR